MVRDLGEDSRREVVRAASVQAALGQELHGQTTEIEPRERVMIPGVHVITGGPQRHRWQGTCLNNTQRMRRDWKNHNWQWDTGYSDHNDTTMKLRTQYSA